MKTIIPAAIAALCLSVGPSVALSVVLSAGLALVAPTTASAQLTATIVGSGSPAHDEDRAGASVLISNGDTRILVDMGNGTQANLEKLDVDIPAISALLFTHHHLDHNEEFVPILVRSLMGRHDFRIIGPPNTTALTESNLQLYAEDIAYRLGKTGRTLAGRSGGLTVRDIEGGEAFEIGGIEVSTLEVPHVAHSIAYRFDFADESIVVTGDLTYSDALAGLARDADFMIIDSGGTIMKGSARARGRTGGGARSQRDRVHVNLSESSRMAAQAGVGSLVYTHLAVGDVDESASLEQIRANYGGNVTFAEDLMVLGRSRVGAQVGSGAEPGGYPIVGTGQDRFYDNDGEMLAPGEGDPLFGQDANFPGNVPSYSDNRDGTVTDNVTGLMWQQGFDVMSYEEAGVHAATSTLGGFDDWRVPTIKEMYSLIQFSGVDASNRDMFSVPEGARPFIDTDYFDFRYGANGDRVIDTQYLTSTVYTGRTMRSDRTVFGVNMADGRIKGYPMVEPRSRTAKAFSVKLVRGNPAYGRNQLADNGDGTVSDLATGLMWSRDDSGRAMSWQEALAWARRMNEQNHLGHDDWRLPDIKELHSIVDYSRSPQATASAAIDPVFDVSTLEDEGGRDAYPFFWSSTTHVNTDRGSSSAAYMCFGEGSGFMRTPGSSEVQLMDVHGAGAQRSDPKTGDAADYPRGHGPQGDVVRIEHYVRLVRDLGPDGA